MVSFRSIPLFIIVFLSVAALFQPDQKLSELEKRKLKTLDEIKLTLNNLENIPSELDEYFKDQSYLKDTLFNLYTRYKLFIGDSPSEDVTLGHKDWFFLGSPVSKSYPNLINHPSQIIPFPNTSNYLEKKVKLKSYLNANGIEYLYVVAPDKPSIYPEYLPENYRYFRSKKSALSDEVANQFASKLGLSFLNLKDDLLAFKETSDLPLYYLWDTHWNARGASIGEATIAKRVNLLALNQDVRFDQYEYITQPEIGHTGDLALYAGATHLQEDFLRIHPKESVGGQCISHNLGSQSVVCNGGKDELKILMIIDSFSEALLPFMSQRYKNIVAVWEYAPNLKIKEWVDQVKPNIVIDQVVEREFLYFSGVSRFPPGIKNM